MTTIAKFSLDGIEPITADLSGWKKVSGEPTMKTYVCNISSGLMSGVWEATTGTYHATYSAYEFVSLLQGKIIITPEGGEPVTVKAGDAFVVEATFKGTWEIVEPVRKYFVVPAKA
ncbi:hypothetical protein DFJ74DRAFT_707822 [Hyaloraphidium curvatum]|nr:hypothetical protein DFJ74DRAFT_707822 [Hyaloraphidium curvatum]